MVTSKGRIVYVGPMSFPEGGAGARRIIGNALSFISAGYEVIVGSGQMPEKSDQYEDYNGISVYSTGERTAENKPVLLKHLIYSKMGRKTVEWLKTLNPEPVAVILFGGDIPYLSNLMPWCKRRKIPIVFEACEWYDPKNMPGGRLSPYRVNFEITMRFMVPRVKNVIAISSYFDNHYKKLGCETICIPPTLDTLKFENQSKFFTDTLIKLCYTGTPGNKDLFDNYLEALLQIDPIGNRFLFNVAGLTESDILSYPAMRKRDLRKIPAVINSIGLVSHNDAIRLVGESDFSILLRYPKRYAFAGFPTKVVESMVMGTPVICNLTSDLHRYIIDGISGIVCDDFHIPSLISALKRVESMSLSEKRSMSQNARSIAVASFDYRFYVRALDDFIQRLKIL